MKPLLARALLAWAFLLQMPMLGVMSVHLSAAQAQAAGQDMVVICTPNGTRTVALSDPARRSANGEAPGAVRCYCPCATACSFSVQPEPGFDAQLVRYSEQRARWLARSKSGILPRPQTDTRTGSPRSPPRHSV